jgi:hypothetical protein
MNSSLIDNLRDNTLGVPMPDAEDYVTIDGGAEISCTTLKQLLPGKRLNNWMIAVVIHMFDKPHFVNNGQNILLDEFEPFGRTGSRWITD